MDRALNKVKFVNNIYVERYCPLCSPLVKLIVKTNRHTDHQFLGCPNWPDCEHTEPIPESMILQAQGAQKLPGF